MVCNEDGRCWRKPGERRVIIRDPAIHTDALFLGVISSAGEERGGIGFRAPGVRVGIGTHRY